MYRYLYERDKEKTIDKPEPARCVWHHTDWNPWPCKCSILQLASPEVILSKFESPPKAVAIQKIHLLAIGHKQQYVPKNPFYNSYMFFPGRIDVFFQSFTRVMAPQRSINMFALSHAV